MSAGAQIDYDALAAKYGGVPVPTGKPSASPNVDLDALAAKYGGTRIDSSAPPATQGQSDGGADESWNDMGTEEGLKRAPFEVLKGGAKGALNTVSGISDALHEGANRASETLAGGPRLSGGRVPKIAGRTAGDWFAPQSGINAMRAKATPRGDLQKLGYGAEQVGEYLIPGAGEEEVAAGAARALPMVGKAAEPMGRVAYNALTTGALNRAQGGSFDEGALLGGAGSAAGEMARSVAPHIAESAIGITKRDRGFSRTPGKEIMRVGGIRPSTIEDRAGAEINRLTNQLETRAAQTTTPVSTKSAVDVIDREQIKAINQNAKERYDALHDLRQRLTTDLFTGQKFPKQMTAKQVLDLKRGVGGLESSWSPETRGAMKGAIRQVYSALDKELDTAMPGTAEINQRISSLIPVRSRAEGVQRNAGVGQRAAHRIAAHTGALATGAIGAGIGYQRKGTAGAVAYGLGGLLAPEVAVAPETQMMFARAARSPIIRRAATGGVSQFLPRKSGKPPEDEEK